MLSIQTLHTAYRHFRIEQTGEDNMNFIVCTNICHWLKINYFPEAVIMGYFHDDNPSAKIGEVEGGHDFLIMENYIIDFWQRNIYDKFSPIVIPLDRAAEYYGNPATWEKVN